MRISGMENGKYIYIYIYKRTCHCDNVLQREGHFVYGNLEKKKRKEMSFDGILLGRCQLEKIQIKEGILHCRNDVTPLQQRT